MNIGTGVYLAAASLLAGTAVVGTAHAGPYTAEYVFGDSLSDRGNLAEILGANFPNPPSNHDSFTNGPVAVQLLAQSYGLNANPSLWVSGFTDPHGLFGGASFVPGTNYAVAGATSAFQAVGGPPGINLPQQVGAYGLYSGGHADPNALYVVDIGGNDIRNAAIQGTGTSAIAAGVNTEVAAIKTLAAEGASKFLVVNVPNVGLIPEFMQDNFNLAGLASTLSVEYDTLLASEVTGLDLPGLRQFDLHTFNANLLTDAASLGFTDTTDRCYTSTPFSAATSPQCGAGAANIDSFVYWDSIHPTARVQALWAGGFEEALPEPSSVALIGVGLLGLVAVGRRRAR